MLVTYIVLDPHRVVVTTSESGSTGLAALPEHAPQLPGRRQQLNPQRSTGSVALPARRVRLHREPLVPPLPGG